MRFRRQGGGLVLVHEDACAVLLGCRQIASNALEAGGMLLGQLTSGSNDIIVDEATRPDPRDRRGRQYFVRARAPAQQRVNAAWEVSGGIRIYLGEWHTHPEDEPTPSRHDLKNWQRIVQRAQYDQLGLLFMIVGKRTTRLWELTKSELSVVELMEVDN